MELDWVGGGRAKRLELDVIKSSGIPRCNHQAIPYKNRPLLKVKWRGEREE